MYWLQTFDIDARGYGTHVVPVIDPFPSVAEAMAEAGRLQRGTHFRITDYAGHVILDEGLRPLH